MPFKPINSKIKENVNQLYYGHHVTGSNDLFKRAIENEKNHSNVFDNFGIKQEDTTSKEEDLQESEQINNNHTSNSYLNDESSLIPRGWGQLDIDKAVTPSFMDQPFNKDESTNTDRTKVSSIKGVGEALFNGDGKDNAGNVVLPFYKKDKNGKVNLVTPKGIKSTLQNDVNTLNAYKLRTAMGELLSEDEAADFYDKNNRVNLYSAFMNPISAKENGDDESGWMKEMSDLMQGESEKEHTKDYFDSGIEILHHLVNTLVGPNRIVNAITAVDLTYKALISDEDNIVKDVLSKSILNGASTQVESDEGAVMRGKELKKLIDLSRQNVETAKQLLYVTSKVRELLNQLKQLPPSLRYNTDLQKELDEYQRQENKLYTEYRDTLEQSRKLQTYSNTFAEQLGYGVLDALRGTGYYGLKLADKAINLVGSIPNLWGSDDWWKSNMSGKWERVEQGEHDVETSLPTNISWANDLHDRMELFRKGKYDALSLNTFIDNQLDHLKNAGKEADTFINYKETEYASDVLDVQDWKNGYWGGIKLNTSEYFDQQELKVNQNVFDLFDYKTWLYGMPGLIGASNSSLYKTIGATAAKLVGGAITGGEFGSSFGPVGTALGAIASGLTSWAMDFSQAEDEADANVSQSGKEKFKSMLLRKGLAYSFFKEGAEKLKDYEPFKNAKNDQERQNIILGTYINDIWTTSNPAVNKEFANATLGLSSMFTDTELSTAGDAAIDAALFVTPTRFISKLAKASFTGLESRTPGLYRLASKAASMSSPYAKGAAIGSLAGLAATAKNDDDSSDLSKIGAYTAIGAATGVIPGLSKIAAKYAFASKLGDKLIKPALYLAAFSRPVESILKRGALNVASELMEETTQNVIQNNFADGYYDDQLNSSIGERIFRDYVGGAPIVADFWAHGCLNGLSNDEEMITSMNGATALSLPMFLGMRMPVMAKSFSNAYNAADLVKATMLTDKIGTRSAVDQDATYVAKSKNAQAEDVERLFNTFSKINRYRKDNNTRKDGGSDNSQSIPVEQELIDAQLNRFKHMKAAARNIGTLRNAEKAGIISGLNHDRSGLPIFDEDVLDNQDYQMYVSINENLKDEQKDIDELEKDSNNNLRTKEAELGVTDLHKEAVAELRSIEDQLDAEQEIYEERFSHSDAFNEKEIAEDGSVEKEQEKPITPEELAAKDSLLSRLKAALNIQKDYTVAASNLQNNNYIASHIQREVNAIKKKLKDDFGISIQDESEIEQHVTDSEYLSNLLSYHRANILDQMSAKNARDTRKFFLRNPKSYIKKWLKVKKDDSELEKRITEGFNKEIINQKNAADREIVDKDTYIASDGTKYEIREDVNHPGEYVKYEINPETNERVLDKVDTGEVAEDGGSIYELKDRVTHFDDITDRLEYHNYKVSQEEKEKVKNAEKEEVGKKIASILTGVANSKSESEDKDKNKDKKKDKKEEPEDKIYEIDELPKDNKPHRINISLSDLKLNVPLSENIELEFWSKPWKTQPKGQYRSNITVRIYLKGQKDKGYFEIVMNEYKTRNKNSFDYSLHFKPKDYDKTVFTSDDKHELFDSLVEMLPDNATVSTFDELTKGGMHAFARLEDEYGFKVVGKHEVKEKDSKAKIQLDIYKKPKGLVIDHAKGPQINIEPTEAQQKTLDVLSKLKNKNSRLVKWKFGNDKKADTHKSGLHYFIREGVNKAIVKFQRLHAFLDEYRERTYNDGEYNEVLSKLSTLYNECAANDTGNKEGNLDKALDVYKRYIEEVNKYCNLRLEELKKLCKNDKSYDHYAKSIEQVKYYISSVHELRNQSNVNNVAKLLSATVLNKRIPRRAVVGGTVVDDILRRYIAGENVNSIFKDHEDDFEGKETADRRKTFDKIINQISAFKEKHKDWILDTTPITWHCTLPNGNRIAGETDMIAIKPDGNIVVVDFKTTKYDITTKLEVQVEIEDPDTLKKTTRWEPYDENNPDHAGRPLRESSDYINSQFNADYTQIEEYIEQLSMYGFMIDSQLSDITEEGNSPKVTGMELFVLQYLISGENDYTFDKIVGVEKKEDENGIEYDHNTIRSTTIDLLDNNIEGLKDRRVKILNYAKQRGESMTATDVAVIKKRLTEFLNAVTSLLLDDDNSDITKAAKSLISEIKELISFIDEHFAIKSIKKDGTVIWKRGKKAESELNDHELQEEFKRKADRYNNLVPKVLEGLQLLLSARGKRTKVSLSYTGFGSEKPKGMSNDASEFKPDNVNNDPIEIEDDDVESAAQWNNIGADEYSLDAMKSKDSKLSLIDFFYSDFENTGLPVCMQEDFLKECTMYVTFEEVKAKRGKKQMRAKVIFKYKGKLYGIKKKDGSLTGFIVEDGFNPNATNNYPAGSPSAMCINLRTKLYRIQKMQLEKLIPENAVIVVTGCARTNGQIRESETARKIWNDPFFFGENGERLDDFINGENSVFGVVGKEDDLTSEHVVYGLERSTNDRSSIYSQKSIYGENDTEEASKVSKFARGTLIFLHKFRYAEDPEGVMRTVPIAMTPDILNTHEIGMIISLLKGGRHSLNDNFEVTVVNRDGSRSKVKTKLTNIDVIRMLIRFNEYWQNNEDAGNRFKFGWARNSNGSLSTKKIVITDMRTLGDSNGKRPVLTLDTTDEKDMKTLAEVLSYCRMNANNNSLLRHDIQDTYSGSPFLHISEMFRDDTEGNIDKIVLTNDDSLSDTDIENAHLVFDREDFDKSYNGVIWMMKHGSIRTYYEGMENPMISVQDVGILNENGTIDNLGEAINEVPQSYRKTKGSVTKKENKLANGKSNKRSLKDKTEGLGVDPNAMLRNPNADDNEDSNTDDNEIDINDLLKGFQPGADEKKNKKTKKAESGSGESKDNKPTDVDELADQALIKHRGRDKTVHGSVESLGRAYRLKRKKQLRRIFGKNMPKILFKMNFETAPNGGKILGSMIGRSIILSDYLPKGGELHEAFHYIMELIMPESVKQRLVQAYNNTHNTNLSPDQIDEAMADQYMDFRNNVERQYEEGWKAWFKNLQTYVNELKKLNSFQIAALYVATDLGTFKYIKPSNTRLEKFEKENNIKYYTVDDKDGNPVEFKSVDDYVGQTRMREIIDSIMISVINCVNIGPRGEHLELIYKNLHLKDIKNLYSKGKLKARYDDKNKMSSWFKYISGFYINEGVEFTFNDALTFLENAPEDVYDTYYDDCFHDLYQNGLSDEYNISKEELMSYLTDQADKEDLDYFWNVLFKNKIFPEYVLKIESSKTSIDQLNATQKLAYELFSNWENLGIDIARRRLASLHMDNKRRQAIEQTGSEEDDENGSDELKEYMKYLMSESQDRSRLESASEQVLFILSTVLDQRYKTIEEATREADNIIALQNDPDVKRQLTEHRTELIHKLLYAQKPGKDGKPEKLRKNNKSQHSYLDRFMSVKEVSTALLVACHHVNNVEELIDTLSKLKDESPMFRKIFNAIYDADSKSVKRYKDGTPKIYAKNEQGEWYIVKEGSYTYKTDENGVDVFTDKKSNKPIKNARVFISHDDESLATQLFQYIKCQRLEFDQTYMEENTDEHGEGTGEYKIKERSGDVEYASKKFPMQWFSFFTGIGTNIFTFAKNHRVFSKTGKEKLTNAIKTIAVFKNVLTTNSSKLDISKISDYNIILNLDDKDDVYMATKLFVQALNNLGIDVNIDEFKYAACKLSGNPVYDLSCLKGVFKIHRGDTYSFTSFYDLCTKMANDLALDISFENNDKKSKKGKNKLSAKVEELLKNKTANFAAIFDEAQGGGANLYGKCSFITHLAKEKLAYARATKDLSAVVSGNKKAYIMTECNSVSDITDDINAGTVLCNGDNIKGFGSKMLSMMIQYCGVCFINDKHKIIGSLVAKLLCGQYYDPTSKSWKQISNFQKPEIKLAYSNGSRLAGSQKNGVSYTEQSTREDIISKMSILQRGGLLFPTLSDKATYFFLKGLKLMGYDYSKISSINNSALPISFLDGSRWYFDCSSPNDQLDQLIEYAQCEKKAIELNLKTAKGGLSALLKVSNFFTGTNNAIRFGSLVSSWTFDDKGNPIEHRFDDSSLDEDPIKCAEKNLANAEKFFFNLSVEDQRKSIAYSLLLLAQDQLDLMEENGLIYKDKNGFYKNVGLDYEIIQALSEKYSSKDGGILSSTTIAKHMDEQSKLSMNSTKKNKKNTYAEHLAIVAYTTDIVGKSIQSEEETERFYTGLPQFFKWKYSKINGKEIITDRYSDQSKRHGGAGSTGDRNRKDLIGIPPKYKCAEFEDEGINSQFATLFRQAFEIEEYRKAYFEYKKTPDMTDSQISELWSSIDDVSDPEEVKKLIELIKSELGSNICNILDKRIDGRTSSYTLDEKGKPNFYEADGAAYITPRMTENLLRMRGAFTEEVATAFAILDGSIGVRTQELNDSSETNGKKIEYMSNAEAYEIVRNALIGSLKYSAYGVRMADGIPVHYYNKFALFPVFKLMTTGKVTKILEKMENEGVDMLLSNQAVKVGGCQPIQLNDDNLSEGGKPFVIYELDYDYIRRQMNTDPHEGETRAIGTQVMKIAMSAIESFKSYMLGNKKINGTQLANEMMTCINALADIGAENIKNRFFDKKQSEDGSISYTFSITKMSKFLKQQLESRNADANLLTALNVVTKEVAGHILKKFNINIESTSSAQWMESIIVSMINKEVIDVNTPGGAYYQRSVFGHEGTKSQIISSEMYNGKPLKLLNEEGSMDAVVSMDYFDPIFEEGWKEGTVDKSINTFEKKKKWLIEHGFISGEINGVQYNASATTVSYRIPTQAQSSVHPLRFVDVLPVVRDTIMLPKEFVAVTGSDFDIDKLYLFKPNYNAKTLSWEFTEEDNKLKHYQNRLVFAYLSALKTSGKIDEDGNYHPGHSFTETYGAVDGDTALSKNVLKDIESNKKAKPWKTFLAGSLAYQIKQKQAFLAGKEGIGPFALNNNSQILTLIFGVKFKKTRDDHRTILDCLNATSLANKRTKKDNLTLSWLSGFINAHVDVAKDPWIVRLNVTKFTWNLVNLLTRVGLDDGAMYYVAQPILKEMSRIDEANRGEYLTDPTKSESQNTKDDIKLLAQSTFVDSKIIDQKQFDSDIEDTAENEERVGHILRALLGLDENGNYILKTDKNGNTIPGEYDMDASILRKVLTDENALIDKTKDATLDNLSDEKIYNVEGLGKISAKEVQYYVYLAYLHLDKYQNEMSLLVNTTKIDTKKQGKSLIEQQAYMSLYDQFLQKLESDEGLFESDGITAMYRGSGDIASFIDHKTQLATGLYKNIVSQFLFSATPGFLSIHNRILTMLGKNNQNKKLSKKVANAIVSAIKSQFFYGENGYIRKTLNKRPKDLLVGDNTTADKLILIQNAIRSGKTFVYDEDGKPKLNEDGTYKMANGYIQYAHNGIITNTLLKCLSADTYDEPFESHEMYKFIYCEGALEDDDENTNDIESAWDLMLHDTETKFLLKDDTVITMADFAKELVAYSFITSGDRPGQTKFFKYAPTSWRKDSGYDEHIDHMFDLFSDDVLPGELYIDRFAREVIENNWTDTDFVRHINFFRKLKTDEGVRNYAQVITLDADEAEYFDYEEEFITYKLDGNKKIPVYHTSQKMKKGMNTAAVGTRRLTYAFIGMTPDGRLTVYSSALTPTLQECPPYYITAKRPGSAYKRNPGARDEQYALYRLAHYWTVKDKDGKTLNIPAYILCESKGKTIKSGMYKHQIYLYFDDTKYQTAFNRGNNRFFSIHGKNINAYVISLMKDYIESMYGKNKQLIKDIVDEMVEEEDIAKALRSQNEFDEDKEISNIIKDRERINALVMLDIIKKSLEETDNPITDKDFDNIKAAISNKFKTSKKKNNKDLSIDEILKGEGKEGDEIDKEDLKNRQTHYLHNTKKGSLSKVIGEIAKFLHMKFIDRSKQSFNKERKAEIKTDMLSIIKFLNSKDGLTRRFNETMYQTYQSVDDSDQVIVFGKYNEENGVVEGQATYSAEIGMYLGKDVYCIDLDGMKCYLMESGVVTKVSIDDIILSKNFCLDFDSSDVDKTELYSQILDKIYDNTVTKKNLEEDGKENKNNCGIS